MESILTDKIVLNYQKQYYKGKQANTFEPVASSKKKELENEVILHNEIQYCKDWPNSFADIFHAPRQEEKLCPTIIYLHGGGWFMGSRTDGDPFVSAGGNIAKKNSYMASLGYNVISLDYCLAPEYRFPEQLKQINEGICFFRRQSGEFGLNMENVIIMGGSAGATMTAQMGLIYSNPSVANELGITPALSLTSISGLVIDGAPLLCEGMEDGIQLMVKTWFGTNEIDERVERFLTVPRQVTKAYPASFLTAGNEGCFMRDEKEMAEALRQEGVEVEEFYIDPVQGKTGHGYIDGFLTDPLAKMGMDRQMGFVRHVTNKC